MNIYLDCIEHTFIDLCEQAEIFNSTIWVRGEQPHICLLLAAFEADAQQFESRKSQEAQAGRDKLMIG